MKRFHVHLGVPDLAASVRFYSDLFGMPPTVEKPDYAKWMLDDPRVNFAISHRGARAGLNHLGVQAESANELADIRSHFAAADAAAVYDEPNVTCCYARGNKHWTRDPQGIAWEAFHTLEDVPLFGDDVKSDLSAATACGSAASQCCVTGSETAAQPNAEHKACCA
jgi:catechol 2,3-dioxygenase-like lactoylglutathione lyase family enzyme